MTQTAAEVAERWEQVARDADDGVAQALIHPSGTAGPDAYRETGRSQATDLTLLAFEHLEPRIEDHDRIAVLDYGCGDGRVLLELDPAVFLLWGTDTSPGMLDRVRARAGAFPKGGIPIELHAPDALEGVTFQLVYCLAVLIHLGWNDGADLVRQMASHVAPGGLLVLDVPLSASPEEGGTWISVTSWSPARLELLAEVIGFELVPTDTVPWHVLRRPA